MKPKPAELFFTILIVLFAAVSGAASEEDARPERWGCDEPRTVIKQLAYLNAKEAPPMLSVFRDLRVRVVMESSAVLITGCPEQLDMAIKILENLDIAPGRPTEVEVVMYILAAHRDDSGSGVSEPLNAVVEELESLFGYSSFSLLDTLFVRSADRAGGQVSGTLEGTGQEPLQYHFEYRRAQVLEREEHRSVRLTGLQFSAQGASIRTDVEVREGQKAVVGKAKPGPSEEAWVLVLDLRILP